MGTQFVYYLRETGQLNLGMSYQSRQPVWNEIVLPGTGHGGSRGHLGGALGGAGNPGRDQCRLAA